MAEVNSYGSCEVREALRVCVLRRVPVMATPAWLQPSEGARQGLAPRLGR